MKLAGYYDEKHFRMDLFFWIGYLDAHIDKENKRIFRKNRLNKERFDLFQKYCTKKFTDKKGDMW